MAHDQRTQQGFQRTLVQKRRLRRDMTPAEKLLWPKLRSKQCHLVKFRRQHAIGPFIVDFFCPGQSLVVEIDGDVHAEKAQRIKDRQRERHLRSLGLQVIRYMNDEVLNNLDGVLEHLLLVLSSDSTSQLFPLRKKFPSLQRRGRTKPKLSTPVLSVTEWSRRTLSRRE